MDAFASLLNQWGQWILIVVGVLYFCMPALDWVTITKLNKRSANLESRLSPTSRESARQRLEQFRQEHGPPPPIFTLRWLLWASAHFVGGVTWLAIR